jgi:hypothetical protein
LITESVFVKVELAGINPGRRAVSWTTVRRLTAGALALTLASASFQDWQVAQLTALERALAQAAGQ